MNDAQRQEQPKSKKLAIQEAQKASKAQETQRKLFKSMCRIPKRKTDLQPHPIFMNRTQTIHVEDHLTATDIGCELLKLIWDGKEDDAMKLLWDEKSNKDWEKNTKFDVLTAFWLCIHFKRKTFLRRLIQYDIFLRQNVCLALKEKHGMIPNYKGPASGQSFFDKTNKFTDKVLRDEMKDEGVDEREVSMDEKQNASQYEGGSSDSENYSEDHEMNEGEESESEDSQQSNDQRNKEIDYKAPILPQKDEESDEDVNGTGINLDGSLDTQYNKDVEKQEQEPPPKISMSNKEFEDFLTSVEVDGLNIENANLVEDEDFETLKSQFRLNFPLFCSNIVEILLYNGEEKLACFLTAYYELHITNKMIQRALSKNHFRWLHYLWAFGKNQTGCRRFKYDERFKDSVKEIKIKDLFSGLKEIEKKKNKDEKYSINDSVKKICEWHFLAEDNILQALLDFSFEEECLAYMGYYDDFLDQNLFLHALKHNNDVFMQKALIMGAFDKTTLTDKKKTVIEEQIITHFKDGSKTNFILNVLHLVGIDEWKNEQIKQLIELFENFTSGNYLENRLILSYNPLMSIALTAEILTKIANSRKRYRDRCNNMLIGLLELGKTYAYKLDEDLYNKLISDTDFRGRSVLYIVCECGFQPLMCQEDPKAENLIHRVWHGLESTNCDGSIFGYSNLMHLLFSKAIIKTDEKTTFFEIVSQKFQLKKDVDYIFQHKYRSKAISIYFEKEALFQVLLTYFCVIINNKYKSYFQGPKIYAQPYETPDADGVYDYAISDFSMNKISLSDSEFELYRQSLVDKIPANLQEFKSWQPVFIVINSAALYILTCKVLFNFCTKNKSTTRIKFDIWTQIDVISAVLSMVTMNLICNFSVDHLKPEDSWKINLNYLVTINSCFQLFRCFSLLLLIESLSKMILTFISMIIATLPFLLLFMFFMTLMTTIFALLYQDVNPDFYKDFMTSFQSVYSAILAPNVHVGFTSQYEFLASFMIILTGLFGNVLMVNYLVAILSKTYEEMLAYGSFLYKVKKFQYCQRYQVAFAQENAAYSQLVIHPGPMAFLNFPILLLQMFSFIPFLTEEVLGQLSTKYAVFLFWIENLFFVAAFAVFEIVLIPFVYIKMLVVIPWATTGLFTSMFYTLAWFIGGIFILIFMAFRDIGFFLQLLCKHDGCLENMHDNVQEENESKKLEVMKQVRQEVIKMYFEIKKEKLDKTNSTQNEEDEEKNRDYEKIDVLKLIEDDKKLFDSEEEEEEEEKEKDKEKEKKKDDKPMEEKKKRKKLERSMFVKKLTEIQDSWLKTKSQSVKKVKADEEETKQLNQMSNPQTNKGKIMQDLTTNKGETSRKIVQQMVSNLVEDKEEQEKTEKTAFKSVFQVTEKVVDKEDEYCEKFLEKFLIGSESAFLDQIDIILMMQALPKAIEKKNQSKVEMFMMNTLQASLIAYSTKGSVQAFEFYDKLNKQRVQTVNDIIQSQHKQLVDMQKSMEEIKNKIDENDKILAD